MSTKHSNKVWLDTNTVTGPEWQDAYHRYLLKEWWFQGYAFLNLLNFICVWVGGTLWKLVLFLPHGRGTQTQIIRLGGSTFAHWAISSVRFVCAQEATGYVEASGAFDQSPERPQHNLIAPESFCLPRILPCSEGLWRNQKLFCETIRTRTATGAQWSGHCGGARALDSDHWDLSSTRPLLPGDMLALASTYPNSNDNKKPYLTQLLLGLNESAYKSGQHM